MSKDFDAWNIQKQLIQERNTGVFYRAREIWWIFISVNIGDEQDGENLEFQRPVQILRGLSRNTCVIVPLTSSPHKHVYRVPLGSVGGRQAVAVISQVRVIDTKRLTNRICVLDISIFDVVRKAAKDML